MTTRGRRWIQLSIVVVAIAGGLLLAIDASHYVAYVAAYSAFSAFVIGVFLLVVGLLLLIWSRTRWVGLTMSIAAILFYGSFLGMMATFAHLGVWSNEPMVRFGPDIRADVVVLLRDDIDEADLNRALNALAERGTNSGIVSQTMIVYVAKHEGYAFTYSPKATPEQRQAFRTNVMKADMVWRVYDNIAPDQIKLDQKEH